MTADAAVITDALALLWAPQPLTTVLEILRDAGLRSTRGVQFHRAMLLEVLGQYKAEGKAALNERGQWQLLGDYRRECYRQALLGPRFVALKPAVLASNRIETRGYFYGLSSSGQAQCVLRLELYSGCTPERFQTTR